MKLIKDYYVGITLMNGKFKVADFRQMGTSIDLHDLDFSSYGSLGCFGVSITNPMVLSMCSNEMGKIGVYQINYN